MRKAYWVYGVMAAAAIGAAVPAAAQSIHIDRDGVRIVPNEEFRGDARRDRRHRDHGEIRGVSERDAVRIARRQGVRNVDSVTQMRRTYRVAGLDRRGRAIRVDIDRRSGAVIAVR